MTDLIPLRGGQATNDPRLDAIVHFDPKSRLYGIAEKLPDKPKRSYTWRLPGVLDQGPDGACVGFGWSHELAARPRMVPGITNDTARALYHIAQTLDEWPGEAYEGTSVLAGAKAVQAAGHMREYRWAFSLEELLLALGYAGPVVLGLNWHTGMMATDANGLIHPTGGIEGRHCVCATAVHVGRRTVSGPNSWGQSWGLEGYWEIGWDELAQLQADDGEACIPMGRA